MGMPSVVLALLLAAFLAVVFVVLRRARVREERYRNLLDQLPHTGIARFDRELRFRDLVGPPVREAGLDVAELAGLRIDDLGWGEQGEKLQEALVAALRGEPTTLEYKSPLTGREFSVRCAPERDGAAITGAMALAYDVSELKQTERERSAEAARRRLILDVMNEAHVATDGEGVVTDWNRGAEQLFGYERPEAVGRPLVELIIPASDHRDLQTLLERRLPGQPAEGRFDIRAERRAIHRDGHEFRVELALTLVEIDGETTVQALMHDISERKRAEREVREHAADVEALADAAAELARSTEANGARQSIARAAARVAGADLAVLFEPDGTGTALHVTASQGAELDGRRMPYGERSGAAACFQSGESLFVERIAGDPAVAQSIFHFTDAVSALWHPIHDGDRTQGVIAVAWKEQMHELSERLQRIMGAISAEAAVAIERAALLERLERMTRTDELTGLMNRRAWDQELERELVRAARDGKSLAIAMLDLDRFKSYNDRLGHQAGDRLLKQAASGWRAALRETDMLARYGGEEFAIAMPGCAPETATRLVERLRSVTPGGESCSAGLASWDGSESADELLGRADAALYEAKLTGRNRLVVSRTATPGAGVH